MALNPFAKPKEECQIHGAPSRSGDMMLAAMILASFMLVAWHVWVYGLSGSLALPGAERQPFPLELGNELRDLFFGRKGVGAELWEVFPYFLAGVFIGGFLRTYKIAVKLQAKLRKYGVLSVFLASFVGIITPLCACGTLTTAISLLLAGIPLAPVMSLMVTSPLLSPSTYLLTLNDLGPEWTVIRTASALFMGIFAGLVTHLMSRYAGFRKNEIFIEGAIVRGDFHDDDYPDERLRCNCRRKFGNRVAVRTGNKFLIFLAKSAEMLWVVGKYILVGVVVGAVVERYMPKEWLYHFFGEKGPLSIVWVTLASVPIFLHQISASSIIYHVKGGLDGTLDGAAALAFMIGGPVTAVPTMVLFWTFFKKRIFFLYLFVCLTGTLIIAYSFKFLVFVPGVDLGNPLLARVDALTGGTTAVICKRDPNVRMVLDTDGRGEVATATNDLDGLGGVVFDGSRGRFTAGPADRYDDARYIGNVARWLGDNSQSAAPRKILVYNPAAASGAAASLLGTPVLADLARRGFAVRLAGRAELPRLTDRVLADYGQLWLFLGADGAGRLSDAELQAVAEYNAKGGAALVVPATPHPGDDSLQEANRLASRYGVTFSGPVETGPKLHVSVGANFFNRASGLLGHVLKLVKKA